jgi:hypothetical protein
MDLPTQNQASACGLSIQVYRPSVWCYLYSRLLKIIVWNLRQLPNIYTNDNMHLLVYLYTRFLLESELNSHGQIHGDDLRIMFSFLHLVKKINKISRMYKCVFSQQNHPR